MSSNNNRSNIVYTKNLPETKDDHLDLNLKMVNYARQDNCMQKNKCLLLGSLKLVVLVVLFVAISSGISQFHLSLIRHEMGQLRLNINNIQVDKTETSLTSVWLPCPDNWKSFTEVKCFKVFDQMEIYNDAVELCRKSDPTASLLSIQTEAEQAFVENYIFSQLHLFNSVWLREQLTNATEQLTLFVGDNSEELLYSNWAEGNPNPTSGRQCIQMLADHQAEGIGKWASVRCQQKGAVVCQKLQHWSPVKLQENLLKSVIKINQLQKEVDTQRKEIEALKNSTIPVGYIHVQLPKELAPVVLWPLFTWKEISADYSGVFFRVVGEGAESFGKLQNESSPRLTKVLSDKYISNNKYIDSDEITPGVLNKFGLLYSHYVHSPDYVKIIRFFVNNTEVRPKNMAVKIWKRIV